MQRAGLLALVWLVPACGDRGSAGKLPWSHRRTQIIDAERAAITVAPVSGSECLNHGDQCLKPQDKCGAQAADILLDHEGHVLHVLCYPGEGTLTVEEIEARRGHVAQNQNDAVILLDELDDGVDLDGDLSIDANNVVVYGEHADHARIAGNLTIDGNNILVRGVRVHGDVDVRKNNVVLALCAIEGDLVISANNAEIAGCDIFGDVTVTGNNVKLYGNRIGGTLSMNGRDAGCLENVAVMDANANQLVDPGELGLPLACQ